MTIFKGVGRLLTQVISNISLTRMLKRSDKNAIELILFLVKE